MPFPDKKEVALCSFVDELLREAPNATDNTVMFILVDRGVFGVGDTSGAMSPDVADADIPKTPCTDEEPVITSFALDKDVFKATGCVEGVEDAFFSMEDLSV